MSQLPHEHVSDEQPPTGVRVIWHDGRETVTTWTTQKAARFVVNALLPLDEIAAVEFVREPGQVQRMQ